jgi:hypothetical protein
VAEQFVVVLVACGPGRGATILAALGSSNETPAAAGGNVAQFLDVNVNHRAGVRMLVAADWLPGTNIDV